MGGSELSRHPHRITEYNWGGDDHINGATAQADILGIFGREGLDLATRWVCPAPKTPTFKAVQMYRNYDGKKSTFGETSVSCAVPDPDQLSAFAARRKDGALTILLIAKESGGERRVQLDLAGFEGGANAQVYQLTAANQIRPLPPVPIQGKMVVFTVPAPSITLLVVPPVTNNLT